MKFFKKFLCILLASVLISLSPMIDYVNINKMETVEASGTVVGTAALLEVLLAAFGVTVSAVALDNLADSFSDWLSDNGSAESLSAWAKASSMSLVTVTAPLLTDVATWITEKIGDLNSGDVSNISNSDLIDFGRELSADSSFVLSRTLQSTSYNLGSVFISIFNQTSYESTSTIFSLPSNAVCVRYGNYLNFYTLTDGILKLASNIPYTHYRYDSNTGLFNRITVSTTANYLELKEERSYFVSTPYVYVSGDNQLVSSIALSDLLSVADFVYNFDSVPDAYTSYGGYDSKNVDALKNMILTPSIISSIMSAVKGAVASNKTEDEEGNVVWSDAIAQAISDAYAAGLADAKAQQGDLEDEAKEEERASVVTGWLSKIYDAILTIPTAITLGVDILSDIFEASVDIKDLITVIPTIIIDGFKEVFPTAETVVELITGIPASMVDALTEVFPVADDLKEWITSVPASIVDAISTGVGVIADGLTAIKDAVLSIPLSIADAIALVLEGLFVPDLTLVEAELDNISDALGWIGDLNSLINDFMLRLEAGDPPTVYLDFTKAEDSKYHGAGLCLAIDFSWYAKYKPTGDLIIGAFIWVMFFWYLFKRIPDIISGAGFITRESIRFDNKMNCKGGSKE